MPQYEITSPSGQHFIVTAPEGATEDEILAYAKPRIPKSARETVEGDEISRGARENAKPGGDGASQAALNALGSIARGAGSIGATILAPIDIAKDAIDGKGLSLESNRNRRADMDASLRDLGVDTDSTTFKVGKVATEVAGTLGVGGAIAAPLRAAAAVAPRAAPALNVAAETVASGGFRTGANVGRAADVGIRAAGGATAGGASAALVNPDEGVGTGAAIGAVLPPAFKGSAALFDKVASLIHSAKTPAEVKIAQELAEQLGLTADDLAAANVGPQVIQGYKPTVPQMMQTPEASQLQRTLKTAGATAIGDAEQTQQGLMRETLEGIAPIGNTVQDAANRAGHAIQDFAVPAEREASKNVSTLFDAIPADEAAMHLPLDKMQGAQTKFLGPGTFGKGGASVEQAMQAATDIGMDAATLTPKVVPFDQLQKLRSSIGEAISDAQKNGRNQAAAALTSMKNSIDNKVAEVASGKAEAGEVFTPEAIDAWGQALAAHAAKKEQFGRGPQVGMFRQGGDGQPAVQGAEIPGKFFNGNRSQVEDVQALKRLVGKREDLLKEMKSFALSEAYSTANQAGNLTQQFLNWAKSRSGATDELFSKSEMLKLREVGRTLEKQLAAENLGRVSGPDTAQKLKSLTDNGLMDDPAAGALVRRIPYVGGMAGRALDSMRARALHERQQTMGNLLADPERMEQALRRGQAAPAAPPAIGSGGAADAALRALPVGGAAAIAPAGAQPQEQPAPARPAALTPMSQRQPVAAPVQPVAPAKPIAFTPVSQRPRAAAFTPVSQRGTVSADPVHQIATAPDVDSAIAGAFAAMDATPTPQPHIAAAEPARAEAIEVAAAPESGLAQAPLVAQADARDAGDASGAPGGPAATWFGRRGDGYVSPDDAAAAMRTRQKVNPDLDWRIESTNNGKYRLAGYDRQDGEEGAALASAGAPPMDAHLTEHGTLRLTGDEAELRQMMADSGITSYTRAPGGLLVGRSQALHAAMRFAAKDQPRAAA